MIESVGEKVNSLSTNKSPGPDSISPKLLKLAGNAIVPSLVNLYHESIKCRAVFSDWKIARLTPIYKKDDETDCGNYRPVSLLSVPSKIMESEVNDILVRHVFKDNNLVSNKQWAYRTGYSTELLLTHLTETWRTAIDSGKAVAVAFIDSKKAFDSVSHDILETKLNRDFGITGTLLDWLKSYLHERQQFTVLNGVKSERSRVSFGIPQGSVLGPTLFTLFTNDLPASVSSGSLYMYADDTTAYCIGETIDIAIAQLNKALKEVYTWCLTNRLTPHPGKSEVMLLSKGAPMGPHAPIQLGSSILRCVTKTRLLGMTVDRNLSWVPQAIETKKSFANKLNLLKRSRFLPKGVLKDFYFKVILPSVKYGLVLWGSCRNSDILDSIERLHCRAARIIFNLPKDMSSNEVLNYDKWSTFSLYYKLDILRLFYKANNDSLPEPLMKSLLENSSHGYSLRGKELSSIPRFNSRFIKDSLRYKGSVLWNIVLYHEQHKRFSSFFDLRKHVVNKDYFKDFNFNALSASTTRHRHSDFIYN